MRIATGNNADRSRFSAPELELAGILAGWDPIEVADGEGQTDEYDGLVRPLMIELGHGTTAAALARTLAQTMTRDYGLAMREQQARGVAASITGWWAALPIAP
jgi:hypothetical protein